MDAPPSPFSDNRRLGALAALLDRTPPAKRASRGYRDMRWLVDQLRQHHGYIAGLTGDGWCRICGVSLVDDNVRG